MKTTVKLILVLVLSFPFTTSVRQEFQDWMKTFKKEFTADEIAARESTFLLKLAMINSVNARNLGFKLGLNAFSHLRSSEFVNKNCKTIRPSDNSRAVVYNAIMARAFNTFTSANVPSSLNLTYLNQPVRDQGNCGSCWSFSTLAMLEAYNKYRNTSWNTQLSPQYLVDCDSNNYGCDGGWPTDALYWLRDLGKTQSPDWNSYPYTGIQSATCKAPTTSYNLNFRNIYEYSITNEKDLMVILANYGPVVIIVYVSPYGLFESYKGGVLYDYTCPVSKCSDFNHGMLLVGYGVDPVSKAEYWLIKNSWGPDWGERGYIRMAKNRNNNCNVACFAIVVD